MDWYTFRLPRRLVRLVVVVAVTTAVVAPATALAFHLFDDVPDGSTHAEGIEYVADRGITLGCDDNSYCPEDPLTRAQMATFLYRSSGNDPATDPSVNADLLDGLDANEITRLAYRVRPESAGPVTSGQMLQTTVRPPVDGLVLVTANVLVIGDATNAELAICGLEVDDSGMIVDGTFTANTETDAFFAETCTSHGVLPLTAGTHEVALQVASLVGSAEFDQGTLSALFVPFNAAGSLLEAAQLPAGKTPQQWLDEIAERTGFPGGS